MKWLVATCTVAGLLNVLLCPSPEQSIIVRIGIALIVSRIIRLFGAPSVAQSVLDLFSGRLKERRFVAVLAGWSLGSMYSLASEGSRPWQVVGSGFLHGALLLADRRSPQDPYGIAGTMSQMTWMSGAVAPIVADSVWWTLSSPLLLALGTTLAVLIAHRMNRGRVDGE